MTDHLEECECAAGERFTCAGCRRVVGLCLGGDDDELCDRCWASADVAAVDVAGVGPVYIERERCACGRRRRGRLPSTSDGALARAPGLFAWRCRSCRSKA